MNVSVTYDETDVAIVLKKIIKDDNAEEFVKLFTPMICQNHNATNWLFKLILGKELPEVIPNGTLCKTHVKNLSFSSNKAAILAKYGDEFGKVLVTVNEFRGFHEYINYIISYMDLDDQGNLFKQATTGIQADELEVIKEI